MAVKLSSTTWIRIWSGHYAPLCHGSFPTAKRATLKDFRALGQLSVGLREFEMVEPRRNRNDRRNVDDLV